MTKINLDKLPRRIDVDGMRWFSESDIQESYTAGLRRALEVLPKEMPEYQNEGSEHAGEGFIKAIELSRSAIESELKCIKQTNK
jgi:hypothetical protein